MYWDGRYFRIQPAPGMDRVRAGKHKGRALQLLAEARAQLKSGTYQPAKKRKPKTLDALEALRFQHEKVKRPDSEYVPKAHNQCKKYISPRLGKRDPDSIRAHEIFNNHVSTIDCSQC